MPQPTNLGRKFATFPSAFGIQTAGYHVIVVATQDNTAINVPELEYSGTANAGDVIYLNNTEDSDISFMVSDRFTALLIIKGTHLT